MHLAGKTYGYKNELENVTVDIVDSLPSSPVTGQMVWHTGDNALYFYDGSGWGTIPVTSSVVSTTIGSLLVLGDSELSKDVFIHDNMILLNYGETGPGVSQYDTIAGIEIDRGVNPNVSLFYDESIEKWCLTNDGSTIEQIIVASDMSGGLFLAVNGSNSPIADIDWGGYRITNLGDPVDPQDAINYQFLDNYINTTVTGLFLRVDGTNQPHANIDWSNHKIINLDDPTDDMDAANKRFVMTQIFNHDSYHDPRFLRRDGGNYPEADISWNNYRITDLADPTYPQDAVTKNYVDTLQGLPSGAIIMWYGDPSTIPPGWVLCDGNNGTPDLRDRFVLGYGTRPVGTTGGEETVTLTTAEMPTHSHMVNDHWHIIHLYPTGGTGGAPNTGDITQPAVDNYPTEAESVTTDNVGESQPHENMPPFMVLCFIMKL